MKKLISFIKEAEEKKVAIGHFNVSDSAGLKAVFSAALEISKSQNTKIPVIIGASEGERGFIGAKQISALVKSLREEYNYPIFLNADHTYSLEKLEEAVKAGFDSAVFDGSKLPIEENIKITKQAVKLAKSSAGWFGNFLVEGEMGYIGSGSTILKEIPTGAAIKPEDFTKPEDAARFVKETKVDLFAPAVGNIHGIVASGNPRLDIERIKEIRKAAGVPLVLHGGSGIKDEDFTAAINAGISVIHINTELRIAWRRGITTALNQNLEEVVPYKLLPGAVEEIKKVALKRLQLFNKLI
ncbi:MAG: ketose-bisphosphate aldolase [Candidatus Paceibacterota bacterium]